MCRSEENDQLRRDTTRHLVDAALEHDVETVVLQSYFAVTPPAGDTWIDPQPFPLFENDDWSHISVMDSMRAAERTMTRLLEYGKRAVVLRCGSIYSETSEQLHAQVAALRAGAPVIPGRGENFWPYLASRDAGRAVAAALTVPTGTYHVADDDPVPVAEFWTAAAQAAGARRPDRIPSVEGPMSDILTGSWRLKNRAFREASGWSPDVRSVREGWAVAAQTYISNDLGRRPN